MQGMSSSLPEDVQLAFYRTIKGFEQVKVMRNAYAIEYDSVDPLALKPSLEFKTVAGLYGAGQFNGTSGYEEALLKGWRQESTPPAPARGRNQLFLTAPIRTSAL